MGEVGTMGVFASKFLQVFNVAVHALGWPPSVFSRAMNPGDSAVLERTLPFTRCVSFKVYELICETQSGKLRADRVPRKSLLFSFLAFWKSEPFDGAQGRH